MPAVEEMIRAHPSKPPVGGSEYAACLRACGECARTCGACADACLAEETIAALRRCIRLNLDCADACDATGRMLSRQFEPNLDLLHRQLELCRLACEACGDECARHGERHEHCRRAAEACRSGEGPDDGSAAERRPGRSHEHVRAGHRQHVRRGRARRSGCARSRRSPSAA